MLALDPNCQRSYPLDSSVKKLFVNAAWIFISPADGPPQDLGGGPEMDGAMAGLSVHPFPKEPLVLHFLPDDAPGDVDLLCANNHLKNKKVC